VKGGPKEIGLMLRQELLLLKNKAYVGRSTRGTVRSIKRKVWEGKEKGKKTTLPVFRRLVGGGELRGGTTIFWADLFERKKV